MGSWNDPERGRRQRRYLSVLASAAVHALILLLPAIEPEPRVEDEILELAFVRQAPPGPEGGPPPPKGSDDQQPVPPEPPSEPKSQQLEAAPPAPVAPNGTRFAALAAAMEAAKRHPRRTPRARSAPSTWSEWQSDQASDFLPDLPEGGGDPRGRDAITTRGRDRCEPTSHRTAALVYLLFDSSGSMSRMLEAQALSCAHQYARIALDAGAEVVVANFALDLTIYEPTRDLMDVEAALRGASNRHGTVLPARELEPYLERAPDVDADMVIISDGWFQNTGEVLNWYRYFLEMNPGNRGLMYTVGSPGRRESVAKLEAIGFDVYMYEQIRPGLNR